MKQIDKFCEKYKGLFGLPFQFDGGLYLMDTDSEGNAVIVDCNEPDFDED